MASVKLILKQDKINDKNEMPLYIRIIKNRKTKYISLGIWVSEKDWNEEEKKVRKGYPNSARTNEFIRAKLRAAEDASLKMETENKQVSSSKIKEEVTGKAPISFFQLADRYMKELESDKKYSTLEKYQVVCKKLRIYLGKKDLTFPEIDYHWLRTFESYLKVDLNNCTNTIHCNFKVIRRIINEAVKEDIVPFEKNPFLKFKLKWEKTHKEFLAEDELQRMHDLVLPAEQEITHHRNMYLFATEAGGLRISDLLFLTRGQYDGERVLLHTQKTSETVSIKLPAKAKVIIDQYISDKMKMSDYIFPVISNDINKEDGKILLQHKQKANALINKNLKTISKKAGIEKKIHFHTSRHTWATRALRKGMRIEYVSKLMGHTSIKTTQVYAKIVNSELDKAMEVFND